MQKRILAGLPILAASLIFLSLWIAEKLAIPSWKSELNQYIDFKVSPAVPPIRLQRAIKASKPWEFKVEMNSGSFSDCIYYQTDFCYKPDEILSSPPLPFPADEVWCALLNSSSSDEGSGWVVYIARHQDLYNAGWIVHESSRGITDPQLRVDLTDIGCDRLVESGQ